MNKAVAEIEVLASGANGTILAQGGRFGRRESLLIGGLRAIERVAAVAQRDLGPRSLGERERGLDRDISATDDEDPFTGVVRRIVELVLDVSELLAVDAEPSRPATPPGREQHAPRDDRTGGGGGDQRVAVAGN